MVVSANGRGNLPSKFVELKPYYTKDSHVLIAIDNIPKSYQILKDIRAEYVKTSLYDIGNRKRYTNLQFTDYWCIEEVLVSFPCLNLWSRVVCKFPQQLQTLVTMLRSPRDRATFRGAIQEIQEEVAEIMNLSSIRNKNPEEFFAYLSGILIDNKVGQFSINKYNQSVHACWYNECHVSDAEKCDSICLLRHNCTTLQERFEHLFSTSLLATRNYGLPLLEIQKGDNINCSPEFVCCVEQPIAKGLADAGAYGFEISTVFNSNE